MRIRSKYSGVALVALVALLALLQQSRSGDVIITPESLTRTAITVAERVNRAHQHALDSQADAAIAELDRAIEQAERHALPSAERARLYALRGQMVLLLYEWDRVLEDYNAALELAPGYADAYFYRGILFYSAMPGGLNREDALADFEHYLQLEPDGPYAADATRYAESIRLELDALGGR